MQPAQTAIEPPRARILGLEIDRLTMPETVARCERLIDRDGFAQQVSVNAAKVVAMRQDPGLRTGIERCALVNADGQSIVWASKLLGDPLPERVAGIDLMQELLGLAERRGFGVYILGARAEVLETAIEKLRARHPALRVSGFHHGYFDEAESPRVAEEIRDSGAKLLFVAISSPRKENWLAAYGEATDVALAMGVGGSIDVLAGITRRAPAAWQRLGLEWMFRLLQEPRRMFGRYLGSNLRFCGLVLAGVGRRLIGAAARDHGRQRGDQDLDVPRK